MGQLLNLHRYLSTEIDLEIEKELNYQESSELFYFVAESVGQSFHFGDISLLCF